MRGRANGRLASAAFAGLLTAGLVMATFAVAQPRRGPAGRGGAKPKPSASAAGDNPYDTSAAAAASASASAGPAAPGPSSSGVVAAPPPATSPSGGPLSPLNPAANEFSDGGAPPTSIDYDRLLADVAALRARVAAVSDTMYRTKIAISLETSGDHGRIASMAVSIDDGIVWTSPPSFRADDTTKIYEHSVAPGHHAVTIDVERRDDRDDTFRSTQKSRFVVDVPNDQNLSCVVKLWDDSDIGGDFRSDRKGQYELRVRMRARAEAIGK